MSKYAKILILFCFTVLLVFFVVIKPNPVIAPKNESRPAINYNLSPITSLFFAGDIMLSRNVDDKMAKTNDYTLPFQKTAAMIKATDIAFANLESPFNDLGNHFVPNSLVFNADPKSIEGLKYGGFNVLATANNHALDQGAKGLNLTLAWLASHGIKPIGTGVACHQGAVIEKNGAKFGFLAYSYTAINNGGHTTDSLVCDANDLPQVSADIKALRPQVDFLIVSMHAGKEYTRTPNEFQKNIAHTAVDSGADLVVGAHPHWVQTIEQYQGKWIFYSLGNFVFDQMWSQETKEGLTVKISVQNKTIKKIELLPIIIEDYSIPRWANPTETQAILTKIGLTSQYLLGQN